MEPSGLLDALAARPWYRSLDRRQWRTLGAANLGWLFDGYEAYALILTVTVAFRELLPAGSDQFIPFYSGIALAVTLLGWGIGGIAGGIAADYLGRKRMLIYSVLAYSLVTGLTAFAWSWTSFVVLRFIVGVALGSRVGHRRVDGGRDVAAGASREGRRADAMRPWDRLLHRLGRLVPDQPIGAVGVALDVRHRRPSRPRHVVDQAGRGRAGEMGGGGSTASRGAASGAFPVG